MAFYIYIFNNATVLVTKNDSKSTISHHKMSLVPNSDMKGGE